MPGSSQPLVDLLARLGISAPTMDLRVRLENAIGRQSEAVRRIQRRLQQLKDNLPLIMAYHRSLHYPLASSFPGPIHGVLSQQPPDDVLWRYRRRYGGRKKVVVLDFFVANQRRVFKNLAELGRRLERGCVCNR